MTSKIRINYRTVWIFIAIFLVLRMVIMIFASCFDPSESRYALITKIMAESNNYLEPQLIHNGSTVNFEGKPPLFFQTGALVCEVLGVNNFSVRFPSMLSYLLILGMVYYTVRKLRDKTTAIFALIFTFLSVVMYLFSGLALIDMMLCAAITGAICAYMNFAGTDKKSEKKIFSLFFFAFLAIGMLTKGPVALVLAGLPIFIFTLLNHRWSELKYHAWFGGILLFLAIAVPWFYLMQKSNPEFLEYFFVNENFKRFLFKEYGDRYGSGRETFHGMALVWFFLVNLPTLLLLLWPLWKKYDREKLLLKRDFRDPLCGLAVLSVFSICIFWCLTSRVLITYLLPTIPFFAIYLTLKLGELEYFSKEKFLKLIHFGGITIGITSVIFLLLMPLIGNFSSDKMPYPIYNKTAKIIKSHPEYAGKSVYVVAQTPYSANFYLGKSVRNHPNKSLMKSLSESVDHLMLIKKYHCRFLPDNFNRKLLIEDYHWRLYAPEKCEKNGDNM